MKLLLVLDSDDTYNQISSFVKPLGFDIIRYNHVLKAMDNIDEIDPLAIIISAIDFPKHWKTMVQFVRTDRSKDVCPIILLKGENFPMEEASKASYLGVSGIVTETLDDPAEIGRLQGILGRYLPVEEKRRTNRLYAESWQRFGFAFCRPQDKTLVTGEVKDISIGGLSFLPDNASLMKDISLNAELEECSLRVGDSMLSPVCRIARTGRIVSMEFVSLPKEERDTLTKYIVSLPLQKLRNTEKNLGKSAAP